MFEFCNCGIAKTDSYEYVYYFDIETSSFVYNYSVGADIFYSDLRYCYFYKNNLGLGGSLWSCNIIGNTFIQNMIGIQGLANPYYNTILSHNNFLENTNHNFYYTNNNPLSIPNNYWGTINATDIDSKIYDGNDNGSYGYVTYAPILTQPYVYNPSPTTIADLSLAMSNVPGNVNLSWTSPGDTNGAVSSYTGKYRIKYSSDSNCNWALNDYNIEIASSIIAGQKINYILGGLTGGLTYYIRIWAGDSSANWSDLSNITTGFAAADLTAPTGKPTKPRFYTESDGSQLPYYMLPDYIYYCIVGTGTFCIRWQNNDVADQESNISGFNIQVGTYVYGNNVLDVDYNNYTAGTSQYSYKITNYTEGSYYVRIRAKNGTGLYGVWSDTDVIILDFTPPGLPNIASSTNPDPTKEYSNSNQVFQISGPADNFGVKWYYVEINHFNNTVLNQGSTFSTPLSGSLVYNSTLADGVWYVHVAAIDYPGHTGPTAHFRVTIKTSIDPNADNTFEGDNTSVFIPTGTVNTVTKVFIQTLTNEPSVANSAVKTTNIIREIILQDGTVNLNKPITVTITYADSDIIGLDETKLRVYFKSYGTSGTSALSANSRRTSAVAEEWILLNSVLDTSQNKITVQTTHTGMFKIIQYTPPTETLEGLSSYPNPFSLSGTLAKITYTLKDDSDVKLRIFDVAGGYVWMKDFKAGELGGTAGINIVEWDGKNGAGTQVQIGAYILRVTVKDTVYKWKIAVIK
jgi:hypothetical protein